MNQVNGKHYWFSCMLLLLTHGGHIEFRGIENIPFPPLELVSMAIKGSGNEICSLPNMAAWQRSIVRNSKTEIGQCIFPVWMKQSRLWKHWAAVWFVITLIPLLVLRHAAVVVEVSINASWTCTKNFICSLRNWKGVFKIKKKWLR